LCRLGGRDPEPKSRRTRRLFARALLQLSPFQGRDLDESRPWQRRCRTALRLSHCGLTLACPRVAMACPAPRQGRARTDRPPRKLDDAAGAATTVDLRARY